ncbi:MAG TPA: anti-sigma factor [Sphingomicrobium sp.]|nr:anti-sigma factor [Sphingomicrobium sp.]
MTDDPAEPPEQAPVAAEHALGLLSGNDLRKAQALAESNPSYREELARWRGRFATLHQDVASATPPANLWSHIEARIGTEPANDNLPALWRKLRLWKAATGAFGTIAAALALILLWEPRPSSAPPVARATSSASPMVAMLGDKQSMKVVASWDPAARQLVLAVAGNMPFDPNHSNELWVIPPGGKPRSLGTMPDRKRMHMQLANALATLLERGATIAISVEPRGGSPSGAPTGAVIASGALNPA